MVGVYCVQRVVALIRLHSWLLWNIVNSTSSSKSMAFGSSLFLTETMLERQLFSLRLTMIDRAPS